MNIKRIIKRSNLEEKIRSFAGIVPLSLSIKEKGDKTVFFFSNTVEEALFNYPIIFNGERVGELNISEDGNVPEFILQLINDTMVKECQIAEICDEMLLLYKEINLMYDLSNISRYQDNLIKKLDCLMTRCFDFVHAEKSSIWAVEGDMLKCVAHKGMKPDKTFRMGEGFMGRLVASGEAEMLNCPIKDIRWVGNVGEETSVIAITLKSNEKGIGVLILSRCDGKPFLARDFKLANVFAYQIGQEMEIDRLLETTRRETTWRTNLSRFLSSNVVSQFLAGGDEVTLGGEEKNISILFADIVNFTAISERMDSVAIVNMLNEYFSCIADIIFKFDGTLDKFIGDQVMAFFGAPKQIEDHALLAVRAGLLMKEEIVKIQYNRQREGKPYFQFRIGINSGYATVGNIGSPNRMDYTAIGDSVNIASRIESNTPPGEVLIGESTYELVKNAFRVEAFGCIEVKGRTRPVKIFHVSSRLRRELSRTVEHRTG